jgi:hypothetical protein
MPYAFRRSLENFADVDICGVKLPWQHKTSRPPAPNSNLGPQPFTFKLQLNRNSGHIARCASTNQQAISPALLRLAIKLYNHPVVSHPSFQLLHIDWVSRVVSLGLCILTASS